jgi:uncharacterized protein (TIGR01589 family)
METQVDSAGRTKSGSEVSYSYVLMVQHLIEWCILLYMERDQCVKSLAKYARVKPVITLTVWNELEKNNPDFFAAYARSRSHRRAQSYECTLEDSIARLRAQSLSGDPIADGGGGSVYGELNGVSCW